MNDGDTLYRAILEDPFDDVPRLLYADWLDDHGEATQAEFIRDQIEWHNKYESNTIGYWDYLDKMKCQWLHVGEEKVVFKAAVKRGFPYWIEIRSPVDLRNHGKEIFSRWPITYINFQSFESHPSGVSYGRALAGLPPLKWPK